jgi:hypothetical protein
MIFIDISGNKPIDRVKYMTEFDSGSHVPAGDDVNRDTPSHRRQSTPDRAVYNREVHREKW